MINYIYELLFGGVFLKKLVIISLLCITLTACGNSTNTMNTKFENEINTFCTNVSDIDAAINGITNITADEAGLKTATTQLLGYLDLLNDEFKKLSNIDFPEEYDYLETIADQASDYMTEAVKSYHTTYEDNYTESMEDYAKENYSRAYKRLQYILNSLNNTTAEEE